MSGGYFEGGDFVISEIVRQIAEVIEDNDNGELDRRGYPIGRFYPPEVIERFREAVLLLCRAGRLVHHIDYLLSGDYSEEYFLEAVKEIEQI